MSNSTRNSKPITLEDFTNVVPWRVYEKTVVMNEVREKRKDIFIGILIALLFITNALWLWHYASIEWVDDYSIEADQDGDGVNIVGGGNIEYGAESNDTEKTDG